MTSPRFPIRSGMTSPVGLSTGPPTDRDKKEPAPLGVGSIRNGAGNAYIRETFTIVKPTPWKRRPEAFSSSMASAGTVAWK